MSHLLKNGTSDLRIGGAIFSGFALLVMACALLVVTILGSFHAEQQVIHSQTLRQSTWQLLSMVQSAETGQRGYLLTGDVEYLQPFQMAKSELPALESRISRLAQPDPGYSEQLKELYPLVDAKLAELSRSVMLRESGDTDGAFALVKTNVGRTLMDQILRHVTAINQAQEGLLETRSQAAARLHTLLLTSAIVLIVLASIIAFAVRRESQRHARAIEATHAALQSEMANREQVEIQLRQAQKMEALGQLTGGVAHDFNNMLAIIVGNTELLLTRLPESESRLRILANNALGGAMRAAELTKQLLAFSRQQPLRPSSVDVNRCIQELSSMLRRSIGADIEIETVGAGGLWRAYVDRAQLESALLNLAVNARDAMQGRGRLTIETANTVLDDKYAEVHSEVSAGQYVMVAVTDTGAGMATEVMHKAFDPFFTTKDVGKGTGLGLSQVHGFTKQSHGHVKIYSEVGVGTTIKLYLPRDTTSDPETASAPAASSMSPAMRMKVLVVEDESEVRSSVVMALQELGYETVEADSAASARHLLSTVTDVRVLLTDVVMPGTSGRQLVDGIKDHHPTLVVIYMTGYTRNAIVHNGTLDANVRLLSKPFTMEELARTLRLALNEPSPRVEGAELRNA